LWTGNWHSGILAQDKRMMQIFNSGQDIYVLMAKEMLDKTIEKSDPLRPVMKQLYWFRLWNV